VAEPRPLAEITEVAVSQWCGVCGATSHHACNGDGNHLSRFATAEREGLITPVEYAVAARKAQSRAPMLTALIRGGPGQ
jgi:hypothetical protein